MNKEMYEFPIDGPVSHTFPLPLVRNFIFKGPRSNIARIFVILREEEEEEEGHLGGSVTGRENVERNDRKQIPLDEREMNI